MNDLIEILIREDDEPNVFLAHLFKSININDAYEYIKEYFISKVKLNQSNTNGNLLEINDFQDQKQIFLMLSKFINFSIMAFLWLN